MFGELTMFECIEELRLDYVGGDEDSPEEMVVEEGSVWYFPDDDDGYRETGSDVRLENNNAEWIEMSTGEFNKHFIEK